VSSPILLPLIVQELQCGADEHCGMFAWILDNASMTAIRDDPQIGIAIEVYISTGIATEYNSSRSPNTMSVFVVIFGRSGG